MLPATAKPPLIITPASLAVKIQDKHECAFIVRILVLDCEISLLLAPVD